MKTVKMRALVPIIWDTQHGRKTVCAKGKVVTLHLVNRNRALLAPELFPDEADFVDLQDFKPILKALR